MHDKNKALDIIEFIQDLKLVDDFYGHPFTLLDWQYEILWDVYGTVENNRRKYRTGYLEIPKKNGKTTFLAAILLYHLAMDPPGGRIFCCAADREQATLVYDAACGMLEQDPDLQEVLKLTPSRKEIRNKLTSSTLKVLSAETFTKHGLNPTVVIFDELHAQPNRKLWDIMTFGAGSARKEPLLWVITTAGDDPDRHSIGWEQHEYARKVRDGELTDPTWYVKIFGAPEDADIYDEKVWFDCNPSLGISVDLTAVRQEALKARNSEPAEKLFRWLRLNQWVSLKRIGWLPITMWDQTKSDWIPADLLGKRCYVGIDLARWIDLAGSVCLFPPQKGISEWRFTIDAWIPEDNMRKKIDTDHVPYDSWTKGKYLTATPGDVIDYGFIKSYIENISKMYDVQFYCGDPWHLEILKQLIGGEIAKKFVEISQDIRGMAPGMSELERLFRSKTISHTENPLGRWCFGNVIVAPDGNENIKPMKNRSIDRIDPICALVDAMAGAIRFEQKQSVYEQRGMRSLA